MMSITKDEINPLLNRIVNDLKQLPPSAHTELKKLTPIKTGNARRNTILSGNNISCTYDYFTALDNGRSRQAPDGMTKPLSKWFVIRINQIIIGR